MKYLEEFQDPALAERLLDDIRATVTQPWAMMEVCGGQTHSIIRHGLDQLLPDGIELIHGPGCPVCVTPLEVIDKALEIASRPDVIFCSFGDMLRVPGSEKDLFRVKSAGGDVRVVYSPMDALTIARENPDQQVVFFGIGFETTAPPNAMTVYQAKKLGIENFSLLVSHVRVPPAIEAIMTSPDCRVQAFLAAGHVCTVMGIARVPAARRAVRACRSWSPASSRSTSSRGSGAPSTSSRRGGTRSRTPTRAPCTTDGNPVGDRDARGRLRGHRPGLARHRDDPAERLAALGDVPRRTTPSTASRSATSTPRSRRSAAAARCCRA